MKLRIIIEGKEREKWLAGGGNFKTEVLNTYELDGYKTTFYRILLVNKEGEIIGGTCLMTSEHPDLPEGIGQTLDLEIRKDYRRIGLGHALYQELVRVATQMGLYEIQSDTSTRDATIKIWSKLGATRKRTKEGIRFSLDLTKSNN